MVFLATACGGGPPAQDENEPEGKFEVDVVKSSFPKDQQLAKRSRMVIEVRNVDDRTIEDINMTVNGFDYKLTDPTDPGEPNPDVADPERPVFVVEKSPNEFLRTSAERDDPSLVDQEVNPPAGGDNPQGGDTSFVNNYRLGDLPPGGTATFRWDVSAVEARPYLIRYEVNAGYDGKAKAVTPDGEPATGTFRGVIEGEAPDARVDEDGRTIVSGNRRGKPPPRDSVVVPPGQPDPSAGSGSQGR